MKRGRPRNPDNVDASKLPQPIAELPKAPTHLDEAGVKVFDAVVKILADMNVLSAADGDLIAIYADLTSLEFRHSPQVKAATTVAQSGFVAVSGDYIIYRDCYKARQKILSDLGMSPAARTRVAAVVKQEVDQLTEFLKRANADQDD